MKPSHITIRICTYHSHLWDVMTLLGYVTMSVDRSNIARMELIGGK